MSKQPIAWHETCVTNMKVYHGRLKRDALDAKAAADRLSRDIFHRERQIAEAKRLGKDGFDAERFMMEKGKPVLPVSSAPGDINDPSSYA